MGNVEKVGLAHRDGHHCLAPARLTRRPAARRGTGPREAGSPQALLPSPPGSDWGQPACPISGTKATGPSDSRA